MIIGIDLASRKSGVVILDKDKNYVNHKWVNLRQFKEKDIQIIVKDLKSQLEGVLTPFKEVFCCIIIEKNWRHPTTAMFLGIWLSIIEDFINNFEIKLIHPWSWYKKMEEAKFKDEKQVRKQRAKDFTIKQLKDIALNWEEDTYDAYCIAYYGKE